MPASSAHLVVALFRVHCAVLGATLPCVVFCCRVLQWTACCDCRPCCSRTSLLMCTCGVAALSSCTSAARLSSGPLYQHVDMCVPGFGSLLCLLCRRLSQPCGVTRRPQQRQHEQRGTSHDVSVNMVVVYPGGSNCAQVPVGAASRSGARPALCCMVLGLSTGAHPDMCHIACVLRRVMRLCSLLHGPALH